MAVSESCLDAKPGRRGFAATRRAPSKTSEKRVHCDEPSPCPDLRLNGDLKSGAPAISLRAPFRTDIENLREASLACRHFRIGRFATCGHSVFSTRSRFKSRTVRRPPDGRLRAGLLALPHAGVPHSRRAPSRVSRPTTRRTHGRISMDSNRGGGSLASRA